MAIKRSIRTPIQNRVVETGNLAFVGGVVADDTTQSIGRHRPRTSSARSRAISARSGSTARRSSPPRSS